MRILLLFILGISFRRYNTENTVPILHEYKSNITSGVGSTIQLKCPISANNQNSMGFYISWTVNGIDENMLSVDSRYQFKDSSTVLEVSNLRPDDSGTYICKGVTGYGVKEATFNLIIKEEKICRIPLSATPRTRFKPCFLNSLMQNEATYQKIVRDIGSSVEFDCSAAGSPTPKYLWMKEKSSADWIENITGIRQPILRINRVKLEYSGYYTCKVSNSVGEISYTYSLVVREKYLKVPRIMQNLGNISATVGTQAMLVGSITCNCKPGLQWFRKSKNNSAAEKLVPIPYPRESERNEFYVIMEPETTEYIIETMEKDNDILVSVLKFKSVTFEDAGKYILFATNGNYGMSYGITFLEVKDSQEFMKKNHPRLVLYIAIPIFILILCFGVIFYCWSRRHTTQRMECPKRFCIGSSSLSSSGNIKSARIHYPGSSTTASATTGKCSNGSSIFGKKTSLPNNDSCGQLSGNAIPLLPHPNSSRTYPCSVNTISQEAELLDPNFSFNQQFQQVKDLSPYSYSKMPTQQVVFPHSNSRVSNTSQPNTQSGSSNCSSNTNRSNSYPVQNPNGTGQTQPIPQMLNVLPNHQMNSPLPPYIITNNSDGYNNKISLNEQFYPQHSEGVVQLSPNMYYTQDFFPSHNVVSSPNSYSFS